MKGKCKYGKSLRSQVSNSKFQGIQKSSCGLGLGIWFLVLGSWFLVLGCGENPKPETLNLKPETIYYCPMHPDVVSNKPGKCPKPECRGMDLIIKMADTLLEHVLKPVNASVLASVKTTKPVYKKMPMDVEANGYIEYDDRTKNNISSLVSGRIEKLFVRYNYQTIQTGEKVFEIYSPELVAAQENLVYILNSDPDEISLANFAKEKLKLLGFSDGMINQLEKTKKVMRTVPVFSKYSGFAYERNETTSSSDGMNAMTGKNNSNGELSVKEGKYVMMGETVINIISKENLAVELQIKSEDIPKVREGQLAEIAMEGADTMKGKIDFIEPILKAGATTMTARIYFNNKKYNYKVGSLVKAKIKGEEFETLWIPLSAIVDLGKEKMVWLKKDGNFTAKKVETGTRSNGMIEIADGLTEESEIAIEAHYLTDSEGFIKENENEK